MSSPSDQIWNQMASLRVLVIGDVMLDKYIWGSIERISPEAPVPVVRVSRRDARLGGAANVALNVRALGASVGLCAVIGQDDDGDLLINELHRNGIPNEGILRLEERPTTTKTRVISGHHHVVRIDEETDKPLNDNSRTLLIKKISDLMEQSDVIIFEDYDKGVIGEELISEVVGLASARKIPIVVDPKKRNFSFYRNVQLFKPNLKELQEGLNLEVNKASTSSVAAATQKLRKQLNCTEILVTLSEYGVFGDNGKEQFHIPAHVREIADVSGAGDSVISIAALAYALKLPMNVISGLANLAGGLVCEHPGVVPIDLEQLKSEAKRLGVV